VIGGNTRPATVLLADDHSLVIEGLRRVLEPEFDVVGAVTDGLKLVYCAKMFKPDVIVVDVSMPLLNGIEATRQIREFDRNAKIVFISMHPDVVYVARAFQAGGSAYVLKSSAGTDILTALREVLQGRTYLTPFLNIKALAAQLEQHRPVKRAADSLTPRLRQVLQLTAEGRSTKEIAEILRISPRTVEFHRYRLMELLGLHSTVELAQYAIKHHIVSV